MTREFSGILARVHQAWSHSRIFHSVRHRSSQQLVFLTNSRVMLMLLVQELYSEGQQSSCELHVFRNNMHLTGLGVSHWFLALGKWSVTVSA